jgi:hypothetical protein
MVSIWREKLGTGWKGGGETKGGIIMEVIK